MHRNQAETCKVSLKSTFAIHASVTKKHFELIQGCETAEEA